MDPTIFTTRNNVVYSHPLVVYQGIDNPLQVVLKNQDQKPVDLSGYVVQADIQDPTNQVTIESFAVVWFDITKGHGIFTIDRQTLDSLEQRIYKLTFKRIKQSDNKENPLFVDDNYGVPIDLQVRPAYYSRVESTPGLIDTVFDGGII